MPETSIIVRTFNEEAHIGRLLELIRAQRYQDFEIINVDSGSTDLTSTIAARYCDQMVQIRSADFTFGFSINEGVRHSSGRHLVCVSAHTEPTDEDWLMHLVAPLREPNTAMVYGRQRGKKGVSKYGESRDMERLFGTERRILKPPNFFANNANAAVRRDLWEQHPFDEALPGLEDIEFAKHWLERGMDVVYEPSATVYHIHDESWPQVRHRYFREAVAARAFGLKGPGNSAGEVFREARWLFGDLLGGLPRSVLPALFGQIVAFRWNKTAGTVKGLFRRTPPTLVQREAFYFDRTARGVVIRGKGDADLAQVPIPEIRPSEVLVKVAFVGVCHTDLEVLRGALAPYRNGTAKFPIIPGHEYSGRVVSTGINVTHLAPGDPVVGETLLEHHGEVMRPEVGVYLHDGAYADYLAIPANALHALPQDADLRQAALCEPLSVVVHALRRAGALEGDKLRVAVVGAGAIGHLMALLLRHHGHDVIVADLKTGRLEAFADPLIETCDRLPAGAYDLVVEASGTQGGLADAMAAGPAGSKLLLVGLPYGEALFSFEGIVAQEKTIVGSVGAAPQDVDDAISLLPRLRLDALTEHALPLEEYERAWQLVEEGAHVKTMLEVDPLLSEMLPRQLQVEGEA